MNWKTAALIGGIMGAVGVVALSAGDALAAPTNPPFVPGDVTVYNMSVAFLPDAGCTVSSTFVINAGGYGIVPVSAPVVPAGGLCGTALKVATRAALKNMGFVDGGAP